MFVDQCNPLPGADWQDRFEADFSDNNRALIDVVRDISATPPGWISLLMRLRNRIVRPLGLRTVMMKAGEQVGGFPILHASARQVILGLDDWHLDFRIVVDLCERPQGAVLAVTTLVRRNNLFGRLYLAAVGPFHRLIVPTMMGRLCENPHPVAIG
jgi:hypothetical protein